LLKSSGLLLYKMHAGNRRQRIVDWILAVIQATEEAEKKIDIEHLVAECCMQFYCGERLVRENLKHLKLTNRIYEEFGELFITKPEKELKQEEKSNE